MTRAFIVSLMLILILGGCVGLPPEPPRGAGGTSTDATSGLPMTSAGSTGSTVDGSLDSGTLPLTSSDGSTTHPIEPGTTEQGTTTSSGTAESTGPMPTTGETGSTSMEPAAPTCDELFGTAPGYVLCMEDAVSCSFNVGPNGNTCTTICNSYGQVCLGGLDNPNGAGTECMIQATLDCADGSGKANTICICSR